MLQLWLYSNYSNDAVDNDIGVPMLASGGFLISSFLMNPLHLIQRMRFNRQYGCLKDIERAQKKDG